MNKKVKKILTIVLSSITGVIMCLVLYMVICNAVAVSKGTPVRYFGYSYSYVPTNSMEPTIKQGDTIIFKKTSYNSLEVGDIIVYKSNTGRYIIHRIVEITEDGLILKGDNNPTIDSEIVKENMVMGEFTRRFNFLNLGKLSSNKDIIYGILVVFFLGLLVLETVNILLSKHKKKLENKSTEQLREEVLKEMKEELLREIKKNNEEDQT